jgi:hypothetical protein
VRRDGTEGEREREEREREKEKTEIWTEDGPS